MKPDVWELFGSIREYVGVMWGSCGSMWGSCGSYAGVRLGNAG